jgi:hypothetical protein
VLLWEMGAEINEIYKSNKKGTTHKSSNKKEKMVVKVYIDRNDEKREVQNDVRRDKER